MNKKKGFTLTEMLIALVTVSALSMVLLPVIQGGMPNKEHIMFKKAYFQISNIISELVNDDLIYPEPDSHEFYHLGNSNYRFEEGDREYFGETKLCKLVASRLNVIGGLDQVDCSADVVFTDGVKSEGQFMTNDGIAWIIPISDFQEIDDEYEYDIFIDTNGEDGSNCFFDENDENACKVPDRFNIKLKRDGRISVTGDKEIEFLKSNDVTRRR